MCESNRENSNDVQTPCNPRNCGTVSRYVQNLKEGISCDRCKVAKAEYELTRRKNIDLGIRDWNRYLETAALKEVLHDYENGRTRTLRGCAIRLKMKSAAALVRRAKLLGLPIPVQIPEHGTLRRYRRGCGCEECRYANRLHTFRYDNSKHRKIPDPPEDGVNETHDDPQLPNQWEFPSIESIV